MSLIPKRSFNLDEYNEQLKDIDGKITALQQTRQNIIASCCKEHRVCGRCLKYAYLNPIKTGNYCNGCVEDLRYN